MPAAPHARLGCPSGRPNPKGFPQNGLNLLGGPASKVLAKVFEYYERDDSLNVRGFVFAAFRAVHRVHSVLSHGRLLSMMFSMMLYIEIDHISLLLFSGPSRCI